MDKKTSTLPLSDPHPVPKNDNRSVSSARTMKT